MLSDRFDLTMFCTVLIIVLLVCFNGFGLEIDKSINLIDFITLIATVFIAVYFGKYLKRKEDVGSRNREIVLNYVEQIEDKLNDYKSEFSLENFDLISINTNNKSLLLSIGNLPKLLEKINIEKSFYDFSILESKIREIHKYLTFYNEGDILDGNFFIDNNKISIDKNRKASIEILLLDIFFELIHFKIKLSNL